MRYLTSLLLLALLLSSFGCARLDYVEQRRGYKHLMRPFVRVKIMETSKLKLRCTGPYELLCMSVEGEATDYSSNSAIVVSISDGMISVDEQIGIPLEKSLVRVVAVPRNDESHLYLNGKPFRGIADIIIENDSITVVNAVYTEDYLKGVLPPEIGRHGKPEFEALKAQAVASRTYAFSRFRVNPARPYDMVNDVTDQIYSGMQIEDDWINKAVDATRGEVLVDGGELITAYYHSTCGGATDNIEDVWKQQPRSYLKAMPDDQFCKWSKFYEWSYTWPREKLEESISEYLRGRGRLEGRNIRIEDIVVIERLPSGRIKVLHLLTDRGKFLLLKDEIRWALMRPDREDAILPSTNFEVTLMRDADGRIDKVRIDGRGNGHGVGMCQCGAIGRSRDGQDYRRILSSYYTGVEIFSMYH
jgi:stage II sporulation protein D